jgi:hypothetical protein
MMALSARLTYPGSATGAEAAMSQATSQPQFMILSSRMSNLDKCALCGRTRATHGIDWTCSSGRRRPGARRAAVLAGGAAAIGGVLALTLTSTTYGSGGTLAAAALLAGLTVLVCTAVLHGRD